MSAKRRLAAILVADVVGYSRLMEADETGTLQLLKERRKSILDPVVREHGGRIVKVMGDGVLVEFASALGAVQGAIELQRKMAEANEGVPEERRIILRIGINLGDVIGEGSDIYGEGVNIAARLEPLAEPGGICVSAKVQEEARGKVDVSVEDLGEQALKNISQPVRAYQLHPGVPSTVPRPPPTHPDKPSIAVLPFQNMSGDADQQYFSDGISEDIITEMSRWHQLKVLSRHSSFQYRDQAADVKRIGRELGVRYVVEGSVRPVGSRLRVTAQLVDADSGAHLWAERYERERSEIFVIQDEMVQTIVGTLVGRVQAARAETARRKPPGSLAAYDLVLRGKALPWGDPQSDAEARLLYEKAIEIDPDYGLAHAMLALMLYSEWNAGAADSVLDRALTHAQKSVELDESESYCHFILGHIHLFRRNFDLAELFHRRAVEINPNSPEHLADLGYTLMYLGRSDEGLVWLGRALRVDPYFNPVWYWHQLGEFHYTARRYDEAIAAFERSATRPPWVSAYIAACHAQAGRFDQARAAAAEATARKPELTIGSRRSREPFKNPADLAHLLDGLRKAGLPE